jgi:hypothetical protein
MMHESSIISWSGLASESRKQYFAHKKAVNSHSKSVDFKQSREIMPELVSVVSTRGTRQTPSGVFLRSFPACNSDIEPTLTWIYWHHRQYLDEPVNINQGIIIH